MAAAAAARSSSSRAAAATETRVYACSHPIINMGKMKNQCSPCSVRVHGPLIVSREYHKIGDVSSTKENEEKPHEYVRDFDQRAEVKDPSLLRSYAYCRDLIHRMLAEGVRDYDLAADNWVEFEPHVIATDIAGIVRLDTMYALGVVPAYSITIHTALSITLTYSEPKALLLACMGEAPGVLASGRKRRRRETAGELCAICFSDVETREEESVRLPCSHSFHRRCIAPWFHRASTCPTCRRDIMECFSFVRSV